MVLSNFNSKTKRKEKKIREGTPGKKVSRTLRQKPNNRMKSKHEATVVVSTYHDFREVPCRCYDG
jgi:hypothetical protein